jgi:hypothetical protein
MGKQNSGFMTGYIGRINCRRAAMAVSEPILQTCFLDNQSILVVHINGTFK